MVSWVSWEKLMGTRALEPTFSYTRRFSAMGEEPSFFSTTLRLEETPPERRVMEMRPLPPEATFTSWPLYLPASLPKPWLPWSTRPLRSVTVAVVSLMDVTRPTALLRVAALLSTAPAT